MKPLAIDLFCGLGGWTEGFLMEGYDVIGFDIERHDYGTGGYPAQLVIQDVLTLHGSQFRNATVIVASPPCQEYSYMAMPWSKAKAIRAEYLSGVRDVKKLTALFDACFRIQREASNAIGGGMPLIVENVRGAIPWVGQSRWAYGSFHLWGDVPALMPAAKILKVPGMNFHDHAETGKPGRSFQSEAVKTVGRANVRDGHSHTRHLTSQRESDAVKRPRGSPNEGVKHHGSGPIWFNTGQSLLSSQSLSRKAASAQIAKIPLPLSRYIARHFRDAALLERRG